MVNITIEGEKASGVLVYDDLFFGESQVKEFPFLLINAWDQNKFQQVDGYVGLSRSYWSTDGFAESSSSFLEALYQSEQISHKIFAIHFDNFGSSEIELGGYDLSKIPPASALTFLETSYDPLWKFTINGFRVGEKPKFPNGKTTAFYTEQYDAILDTFNPYIKIPKSIATQVFNIIMHETQYELIDDMLMGPCTLDSYWSVSLFVNDRYYIKLAPESFVMDIGKGDKCFLPF